MDIQKFKAFVLKKANEKSIDPVVIFFGKRNVAHPDNIKIQELGRLISEHCPEFTFRSGNQNGADAVFASAFTPQKLQVCTPYAGHRDSNIPAGALVFPLDQIILNRVALTYFQLAANGLYNAYQKGQNTPLFQKASYLLRNLAMVYGFTQNSITYPPASFALYFDDLLKPNNGGTGFTRQACINRGVSVINQKHWSNWLPNDLP